MQKLDEFLSAQREILDSLPEEKKKIFQEISRKKEDLEKIDKEILSLEKIIKEEKDKDLIKLAQEDRENLEKKKESLRKEIEDLLEDFKTDTRFQKNSLIVEIRAGTGGEEAALFAADLFRMYKKYAENQGWKIRILDERKSDLSGYKEVIFEISGKGAFQKMRYEGGVHRVQRIPVTEKSGRIHTSTATVAILPKPKKEEIKIKPEEIKVETYRASGPGGQYVNKRETAVRVIHLPTGIVVTSQTERSQLENKQNALSILEARLWQKKEEEMENKISSERRKQIKTGERSEKIRTYNFPQDRVTDHRIKKTWHNIDKIMEGRIESIIEALQKNLS